MSRSWRTEVLRVLLPGLCIGFYYSLCRVLFSKIGFHPENIISPARMDQLIPVTVCQSS